MKQYIPRIPEKEACEVENCFTDLLNDIKTLNASFDFEIYSNEEACKILGVTYKVLTEYRNEGLLSYSRVDDKYWYTNSDIDNFIKLTRVN